MGMEVVGRQGSVVWLINDLMCLLFEGPTPAGSNILSIHLHTESHDWPKALSFLFYTFHYFKFFFDSMNLIINI